MASITTVYTYALDSSRTEFPIPFEYLARRFVSVTLIGTDRKPLTLNSDYRFASSTVIKTMKAWGAADGYTYMEIKRLTSATDRLVSFADGSILRATDLNLSQIQTMHVAEEARNAVTDTIGTDANGMLDARARRIVNLADAINPGDAVTLRQEQAWAQSALNSYQNSAASAAASLASQKVAATSETNAKTSETNAKTSETNAASSKTAAATSATNAATSETNAASSKTAAATSATNAATSATNAAASAQTALTESAKLVNNNAFAGALDSVNTSTPRINYKATWQQAIDTILVDNLYGRTVDNLFVQASMLTTKEIKATGVTSTNGITAAGNVGAVSGYTYMAGNIIGMRCSDTTNASNMHLWFYNNDNTERGLIYLDNAATFRFRSKGGNTTLEVQNGGHVVAGGGIRSRGGQVIAGAENGVQATLNYDGNLYGQIWGNDWISNWFNGNGMRQVIANIFSGDVIGAYVFAQNLTGAVVTIGGTAAGSALKLSSHNTAGGAALSGTWRCMGYANTSGVTLWIRIA